VDFFGINSWEFVVLLLLAMFIFGPDRLPKAIADGVKMIRNLRDMARNATSDLSRELGTDISLEDLNPKALIRKHILSEEDERALRRPLDDLYHDVRNDLRGVQSEIKGVQSEIKDAHDEVRGAQSSVQQSIRKPVNTGGPTSIAPPAAPAAKSYDLDAT
jgi:sec-independent protein translocase protein TatB